MHHLWDLAMEGMAALQRIWVPEPGFRKEFKMSTSIALSNMTYTPLHGLTSWNRVVLVCICIKFDPSLGSACNFTDVYAIA